MGASFHAYRMVPIGCCDVGYRRVHSLRVRVLGHVGSLCGRGTEWGDRYAQSLQDWEHSERICDELFREMESHAVSIHGTPLWEILIGAIAFCNHSDCDGDFYSEDCECIAKALRSTLDNTEMPEADRDPMDMLYRVFSRASAEGCRVEISRSRNRPNPFTSTPRRRNDDGTRRLLPP